MLRSAVIAVLGAHHFDVPKLGEATVKKGIFGQASFAFHRGVVSEKRVARRQERIEDGIRLVHVEGEQESNSIPDGNATVVALWMSESRKSTSSES